VKLRQATSLRILDFDIENRPLSYLGMDFTTADVTAIAAGWTDKSKVECWMLGEVDTSEMLASFVAMYDEADIVTGHYIRKHDLPIINGALMEAGMPTLKPKLSSDTKLDMLRRSGISCSQESLAGMLGLPEPKKHMTQTAWRAANRLTPGGIQHARERVVGDIRQHKALRERMVEAGLLGPPKTWAA
jgi:hypothetical protein